MMNYAKALILSVLIGGMALSNPLFAENQIAPGLQSVDVMHKGKSVNINRSDDKNAKMPEAYARVSRHCPPFCVQPASIAQGVDSVGELEVLGYLKRIANGDRTIMVVDSRTPEWVRRGTIPGSVNVPWNQINVDVQGSFEIAAEAETLADILQKQFGAQLVDGKWDFRNAKTLVLFCNGIWCPQSGANIQTLLNLGYPAYKLKWYRGGMQDWVSVGLTTVNH